MSTQEYDELEKLFNGTWIVDRDENFQAFMDAAEFPDEMKKMIAVEKSYTLTRDGSTFREISVFGEGVEMKTCLKLNQENDFKDNEQNPKIHVKTTPTLKDGVLIQDIQPMIANSGKKHRIRISRQGDELVVEMSFPEGSNVTAKRFYKRS